MKKIMMMKKKTTKKKTQVCDVYCWAYSQERLTSSIKFGSLCVRACVHVCMCDPGIARCASHNYFLESNTHRLSSPCFFLSEGVYTEDDQFEDEDEVSFK